MIQTNQFPYFDEIDKLGVTFLNMQSSINKNMHSILELTLSEEKLKYRLLQSQINPHFLYNTLFSIQCMVELNKSGQAVKMIKAFIALLRKTLSTDRDLIPLIEELENTKS